MLSHGILLEKNPDLFSLRWNLGFSWRQLRPGSQHYVHRLCPQAHPTCQSAPQTQLSAEVSGLQHCMRWYFVPKNLYEKVNLFQIHREDTSGWYLVWHTCFWGVGHYVSPSLGTKDPPRESFLYGVGIVSTVNIMLSKDTPTKITLTIYTVMAEKDSNEKTYPGPTICSGQIGTNCPRSIQVILLPSLLAGLAPNYP